MFSGAPPDAPASLLATGTSPSQIQLSWVETSPLSAGIEIGRSAVGATTFTTIANLPAGTQSYTDGNLAADTEYQYEIVALSGGGGMVASYPTIGNTLSTFAAQTQPGDTQVGGFQYALPNDPAEPTTDQRNNIFYQGTPVVFDFAAGSTLYEVRDYNGNLVDSGNAVGSVTLNVTQLGWYKLYVYGPSSNATYGNVVGGTTFSIVRVDPNFPTLPPAGSDPTGGLYDEALRDAMDLGPQRYSVTDVTQPAEAIAEITPNLALDEEYYLNNDPTRHPAELIAFTNGTADLTDPSQNAAYLAGVAQIVEAFHGTVKYYEGRNEPNFYETPQQFVAEERDLYNTIKSIDPTCELIGPGVVDLTTGYGLAWDNQFFAAGGGQYIDAFSFHAYNAVNGDLFLARDNLNNMTAMLASWGLQNLPIWQTEQGYPAPLYGSYDPNLQGRWTMLQYMIFEQYGIPLEQDILWYDVSHGFWNYPEFFENSDGSVNPEVPLLNVWSEEIYVTNFTQALDFGPTGNNLYVGDEFQGGGRSVLAIMSAGSTDGQVQFKVQGGTSLNVVSDFGVESTIPVVNGVATLAVGDMPVYVELAAGQVADIIPQNWGTNVAALPGVTALSSGDGLNPVDPSLPNDIGKTHDGVIQSWYLTENASTDTWYDDTPAGKPAWLELDFPQPTSVDSAIVYSGDPWQWRGSLLDFQLQYFDNTSNSWVNVDHVQEQPKTLSVYSPVEDTTVDSFYSQRWIFPVQFQPVTISRIRILVNSQTYGGAADALESAAGGQSGPDVFCVTDFQVFGTDTATTTTPAPSGSPPTATFDNLGAVEAGSGGNVQFTAPSQSDVTYSYDFSDDGTFEVVNSSTAAISIPAGYFLTGASTLTVRGRITDAYGLYTDYTTTIPIEDPPPTATFSNNGLSSGGALPVVSFSDPFDPLPADRAAGFTYSYDFADNGTFQIVNSSSPSATIPASFIHGPGGYTVHGRITDKNGNFTDYTTLVTVPATGATADGSYASFVDADSTTAGNWQGVYGQDGYDIFGQPAFLPGYVDLSYTGVSEYVWNSTATDPRAPELPGGGRYAATYYTASSLTYDINFNDGNLHQVALYCWDEDSDTRRQQITITDAVTGQVLDTRTLTNFNCGVYLVWSLSGNVLMTVTDLTGSQQAVTSGLFFGPIAGASSPTPPATNVPPVTADDNYTATENASLGVNASGGVLADDTDPEGRTMTAVLRAPPVDAAVFRLDADGSFTYTPLPGFVGTDEFTYIANDGAAADGSSVETDVFIKVAAPTIPPTTPVANPGSYTFAENNTLTVPASVGVLTGDSDPRGLPLTAVLVSGPFNAASFTLNSDGSFDYTPAKNFFGTDQFTCEASDGSQTSSPVTVTLTITPVNQPPTTQPVSVETIVNTALSIPEATILADDTPGPADESAQTLTITAVSANAGTHGTVTLNTDGSVGYVPASDYVGSASFTYTVTDDGTTDGQPAPLSATGTVDITVAPAGTVVGTGNAATLVGTDSTTGGDWIGKYGSDGYDLFVNSSALPSYVQMSASGESQYVWANPSTDPRGLQTSTGSRVAATWYSGSSYTIDLNFTDGKTHQVALYNLDYDTTSRSQAEQVIDAASGQVLGTVTVSNFSSGEYVVWDLTGDVQIKITNAAGSLNAVTSGIFFDPVAGTVTAGIPSPVTSPFTTSVKSNGSVTIPGASILAVDSPGAGTGPGQTLAVTAVAATGGTHGTVVLNSNGSVTYTPTSGYAGTASFNYTVTETADANGSPATASATGTVNVTVLDSPPIPVLAKVPATTPDVPIVFNASASTDPDGNPLTFVWNFGDGSTGTGATPSHAYTGDGVYSVTVTVSDGYMTVVGGETVAISDRPPTAQFGNSGPVIPGQAATVWFSDVTEASPGGAGGFTYSYDFNDDGIFDVAGSSSPTAVVPAADLSTTGGHIVVGRVTNADGLYSTYTTTITVTSPAAPAGPGTYVGSDSTTGGNWQGVYGADGYNVVADSFSYPAYARVAIDGAAAYVWNDSPTDTRSLERASESGRIAAAVYSPASFTVGVDVTDGQTHQVALYFLDDDGRGRVQTVQMIDPSTGNVLDTRTVSNFSTGQYLVYDVSGNVQFSVTNGTGSVNAVLSGLFFGQGATAATTATPAAASATFNGSDTTTEGNWSGTYGGGGYTLANGPSSLASYVTASLGGESTWDWSSGANPGPAALETPAGNRLAAAWYGTATTANPDGTFTVDLNFTDGKLHKVSAYFMDYDAMNRSETVHVVNATTGAVLDSESVSDFSGGTYLSWMVSGNIQLRISNTAGSYNNVLSGLFFD